MNLNAETIAEIHRDNLRSARRTVGANLLSLLITAYIAVLVFVLSLTTAVPPPISAFSTDRAGLETRLSAVVNPAVTEEQAIRWVKGAVIDLMSIRFDRYETQIESRERYFYGEGFDKYRENLYANVVPVIRDELLIVTAINVGKPKRVRMQRIAGVVQRTYQVTMLQTTQGPTSERKTEKRVVVITVTETTRDKSIHGLQIKRFYVTG